MRIQLFEPERDHIGAEQLVERLRGVAIPHQRRQVGRARGERDDDQIAERRRRPRARAERDADANGPHRLVDRRRARDACIAHTSAISGATAPRSLTTRALVMSFRPSVVPESVSRTLIARGDVRISTACLAVHPRREHLFDLPAVDVDVADRLERRELQAGRGQRRAHRGPELDDAVEQG